jgi:GH35 family endo-1,4-beta-xylanase
MRSSLSVLALAAAPLASAQLNYLAKKAGLEYFGTASDVVSVAALNATYAKILSDTREFGQLTPANGMKVRCFRMRIIPFRWSSWMSKEAQNSYSYASI